MNAHQLEKLLRWGSGVMLLAGALVLAGCRTPDYTNGQSNVCEVHNVAMTKRGLLFAHGMIPRNHAESRGAEWSRRMAFYPHPGDGIPATDIVLPGERGRALAFVCKECERAMSQMRDTTPNPASRP